MTTEVARVMSGMNAYQRLDGLFVVVEGADGSGKTAIVNAVVDQLRARGTAARRVERSQPYGEPEYVRLVEAVDGIFRSGDQLFRTGDDTLSGYDLLSLAAAAQYLALVYGQVLPIARSGGIAIAESWWSKTWARLSVEVGRCFNLTSEDLSAFTAWQRGLLPEPVLPAANLLTVLIDVPESDRARWHEVDGMHQRVFGEDGASTTEPAAFGRFTSEIASILRTRAAQEGWPVVANGSHRSVDDVAWEVIALIEAPRGKGSDD
ncbi:hypothetical protein R8Z50_11105 [Longispora sp. K20-0274]|uniref:hypothetical protein n=1 Tax=Longispora sp. K20-0274 TaxID=3088255 RepID=UPI00399AD7CF